MSDSGSDWLASDGEEAAPLASGVGMEQRDRMKAERLFETEGWREGISAGTAAALQPAFNKAFNEVGAPLGRRVGRARGAVDALARALHGVGAASPAMGAENSERERTLAALDRVAGRLAPLDWTTLSHPVVDPHKDGFGGDHSEPPPNLPEVGDAPAAGHTHSQPTSDPQAAERVEQARRDLEAIEQEVVQLQEQALRVLARSKPTQPDPVEPRTRTRRGQARKVQAVDAGEKATAGAGPVVDRGMGGTA